MISELVYQMYPNTIVLRWNMCAVAHRSLAAFAASTMWKPLSLTRKRDGGQVKLL